MALTLAALGPAACSPYSVEYRVTDEYVDVYLYDASSGEEGDPNLRGEDPDSVRFFIDVDGFRRCTARYDENKGSNCCRVDIPWEVEPAPAIGQEGVRFVPRAYLLNVDAVLFPEKNDCMMWGDTDLFGEDPGFTGISECHKIHATLLEWPSRQRCGCRHGNRCLTGRSVAGPFERGETALATDCWDKTFSRQFLLHPSSPESFGFERVGRFPTGE